jgi:hypothetical protein
MISSPPGLIIRELKEINNDKNRLTKIAENSYQHDNGFFKIVLQDNDGFGRKVRLHIFPKNAEIHAAENFHNHRWEFTSNILVGQIRNDNATFERADNGKFTKWNYVKQKDGTFSLLPTTETWNQITINSNVYISGDSYQIKTGTIHRIIPSGKFTATLVHTQPASTDSCFQWAEIGHDVGQNGVHQKKEPLEWWEVRRLISEVLTEMEIEGVVA